MRSTVTPECENLGRTIKSVSVLLIIFIVVTVVLLIVAISYNYMKKGATDADHAAEEEARKGKIIGGLSITGALTACISMIMSVWLTSVAGKMTAQCLTT